jgi:hypothetical protein
LNEIGRLYLFRKKLLLGIFWASGFWAGWLVIWIIFAINKIVRPGFLAGVMRFVPSLVLVSAFVVLFFLLKYWRFKWTLRKSPALGAAIDDERVSQAWLKAYRFAFFFVVALHILLLLNGSFFQLIFRRQGLLIPGFAEYPLTLLVAVISCLGAFLHYSQEH